MADEKNWYLSDLQDARATVSTQIEDLLDGHASLEAAIVSHVVDHRGWVCCEADTWVTELRSACSPVVTAFDDAVADLDAVVTTQAQEPTVPEGEWRGLSWKNSH